MNNGNYSYKSYLSFSLLIIILFGVNVIERNLNKQIKKRMICMSTLYMCVGVGKEDTKHILLTLLIAKTNNNKSILYVFVC